MNDLIYNGSGVGGLLPAVPETTIPMPDEPKTDEGKTAVKIDDAVVSKARIISARRKVPMADYLSDLLRPLVNRDYSKTIKELADKESQQESK